MTTTIFATQTTEPETETTIKPGRGPRKGKVVRGNWRKWNDKHQTIAIAGAVIVLLLLLSWLISRHYYPAVLQTEVRIVPTTTNTNPPPPIAIPSPSLEEQIQVGTVTHGKGFEHALRNAFIARPKHFGFTGDVNNNKAVFAWANTKVELAAGHFGFREPKLGLELRVSCADCVAYVPIVDDSGNLKSIDEYAVHGSNYTKITTLTPTRRGLRGISGHEKLNPSYEYIYPR